MMSEEERVVNGVQFETDRGALAAWMRIHGDSVDTFWEMLLLVREESPHDWEAFAKVERAWILELDE